MPRRRTPCPAVASPPSLSLRGNCAPRPPLGEPVVTDVDPGEADESGSVEEALHHAKEVGRQLHVRVMTGDPGVTSAGGDDSPASDTPTDQGGLLSVVSERYGITNVLNIMDL